MTQFSSLWNYWFLSPICFGAQPRARYKQSLDPTVEDVKKLCDSLRRGAKDERVLFHYNGHGVPRPTSNSEMWVFNKNFTQYIPLSVYDLQVFSSPLASQPSSDQAGLGCAAEQCKPSAFQGAVICAPAACKQGERRNAGIETTERAPPSGRSRGPGAGCGG